MVREEPELRISNGLAGGMYADGGSDEARLADGGLDTAAAVELAAEAPAPSSAACRRLPWLVWAVVVGLTSSIGPFLG